MNQTKDDVKGEFKSISGFFRRYWPIIAIAFGSAILLAALTYVIIIWAALRIE